AVCEATRTSAPWERIDLTRVRREPLLLVVGVPQAALGRLRWLCHLFLRDLAAHLLRPRRPEERVRVLLILEELPAWGPLPGLAPPRRSRSARASRRAPRDRVIRGRVPCALRPDPAGPPVVPAVPSPARVRGPGPRRPPRDRVPRRVPSPVDPAREREYSDAG